MAESRGVLAAAQARSSRREGEGGRGARASSVWDGRETGAGTGSEQQGGGAIMRRVSLCGCASMLYRSTVVLTWRCASACELVRRKGRTGAVEATDASEVGRTGSSDSRGPSERSRASGWRLSCRLRSVLMIARAVRSGTWLYRGREAGRDGDEADRTRSARCVPLRRAREDSAPPARGRRR